MTSWLAALERFLFEYVHTHPKPINPKAKRPNRHRRDTPTKHVPPTKKPGEGLTGYRADVHRVMHATVGNPYHWMYYEVRPLQLPKGKLSPRELAHPVLLAKALRQFVKNYRADCSWGAKTIDWLVGAKDDPTGEQWGPWGNSTTTYEHLEKRPGLDNASSPIPADLAKCEVGDFLLFGPDGAWHETRIMEAGPDPLLWSDGGPGTTTPNTYSLSDDARRPVSVCIPKG